MKKILKQIIWPHNMILKQQNLYCEQTLFQEQAEGDWQNVV